MPSPPSFLVNVAPPDVEHATDYVSGYPMHVAVTVHLEPDERVVWAMIPHADVYLPEGVSVKFTEVASGAESAFEYAESPFSERPPSGVLLYPGDRRRMLIDLADLEQGTLAAGKYRVTLTFGGSAGEPFEMTLHAPTPAQKATQAFARTEGWGADGWGKWALAPLKKPGSVSSAVSRTDPLRYCRVLRYLTHLPGTAASVPSSIFDALDGLYAPEAALLRADLAWARKDAAAYAREAAKVKEKYPALAYALANIEAGIGVVQGSR